jgi:hypothetical protein
MMRTIDDLVADALSADEKEILRRIGPEPGLIGLTAGLFTGRLGWVNAVLMAVQALAFLAGAYAAYRFFLAEEVVAQLRWGLPAVALLLMSLHLKALLWPSIQTDRVLRELKRLEFLVERSER